jgi:sulfite exporter TauE/SafE
MMQLEGFMLGLSSGAACMAVCAPVLVPYLLGEGQAIIKNALFTGQFLVGRLLGYLLFSVLAWGVGRAIIQGGSRHDLIIGTAYLLFAALLLHYGFFGTEKSRERACTKERRLQLIASWPAILPIASGFATGLSFCPPFLLAFTGAAEQTTLLGSAIFFLFFFLGTSIPFLFAPLVGLFRGFSTLRLIGKMAAGVMGIYYLYSGTILLLGGIKGI